MKNPLASVRNANDCYPTPPCAALGLGMFLDEVYPIEFRYDGWLDSGAGFGTLLPWMGISRIRRHGIELAQHPDQVGVLRRHILEDHLRLGVDALQVSWACAGVDLHSAQNPAFGVLQRFVEHAVAEHERARRKTIAAILTPVGFWHAQRRGHLPPPAHVLALAWRPDFAAGFLADGREGGGTFQDFIWAIYGPRRPLARAAAWVRIERPEVPAELVREHAALAQIAARLAA